MRKAPLFALVAMLAACSDSAVAPQDQTVDVPNVSGGGVTAALTPVDTMRFSLTIDPSRMTSIPLGAGNNIIFPAGSVCDPAKSAYGPGQWDKACTALKVPITVNVKAWLDASGNPGVDFSPNIRFVPSLLPTGWVTLTFADFAASLNPMFNILYCKNPNASCTDESKSDPTLITLRNALTGQVSRRVKHFSGYMVGAGRDDGSGDGSGDGSSDRIGQAASFGMSASNSGSGNSAQAHAPKYKAVKLKKKLSSVSASADIGPEGGTLRLAATGLTIVVPPGAVATRTHFSVTTVGGGMLGYAFEPHGTQFAVPLQVTQDLGQSDALSNFGSQLQVAYYSADGQVDMGACTVEASELLGLTLDRSLGTVSFNIWHFSGYMLVSGRADE